MVSNVVLTDSLLLFFKDSKAFLEKGQKPEHCVDLKGASIEWCQADKSKRSNVFEVIYFVSKDGFKRQMISISYVHLRLEVAFSSSIFFSKMTTSLLPMIGFAGEVEKRLLLETSILILF